MPKFPFRRALRPAPMLVVAAVVSAAFSATAAATTTSLRDSVDTEGPTARVINGTGVDQATFDSRWSATVALVYAGVKDPRDGQFCAGTLIAPKLVVTAAHCVTGYDWQNGEVTVSKPSSIDVIAGRRVLSRTDGERIDVTGVVARKQYDDWYLRHDIGLLHLETAPVGITPMPLVAADEGAFWGAGSGLASVDATTGPWVGGWGTMWVDPFRGEPGAYANTLRQAVVDIRSDDQCENGGPGAGLGFGRYFDYTMMCAGKLETSDPDDPSAALTGADSCYGDSGGPLLVAGPGGAPRLAGMVSWGYECGGRRTFGVYTRIAAQRPWIESNPPMPVRNVKRPKLYGMPFVGQRLHCGRGTWVGGGKIRYRYRWLRKKSSIGWEDIIDFFGDEEKRGGHKVLRPIPGARANEEAPYQQAHTPIKGAHQARYRLTRGDLGKRIVCEVKAENASWRSRRTSNAVGKVRRLRF